MERKRAESIGDVLRQAIEENMLAARLDEFKAIDIWKKMMGDGIVSLCGAFRVNNGVLGISVPSASLRQELTMHRSEMIRLINARLGRQVISDIKFTG